MKKIINVLKKIVTRKYNQQCREQKEYYRKQKVKI